MKKKILVTGGTGTIGKALISQLLQNHYDVVTLSRRPSDNIVPHWQIDLSQPYELEKVTEHIDQVIHLAANVDACNGPSCFIDNVFTTLNIMQWAQKNNIKKIIYASTSGVYDIDGNSLVSELSPIIPVTLYAWTKYLSERILLQGHIASIILRFPHLYGPTDAEDRTMAKMIKRVCERRTINVKNEERDYLHVTDAVTAILKAIEYSGRSSLFNCGSGRLVSMDDIIRTVMMHSRNTVPVIIAGKRTNVALDSSLAYKELKWEANISLDYGIKELVNVYIKKFRNA